jgi:hypothetical protein
MSPRGVQGIRAASREARRRYNIARSIPASFDSCCAVCRWAINEGDRIVRLAEHERTGRDPEWVHLDCVPDKR